MKNIGKQALVVFLVLAAASALCLVLNRFDNKYTRPGIQPLEGLLVLSQEELENHDIHFLIHGWAFYPDILLTPEKLEEGVSDRYMVYTSIGERPHFDLTDSKNPYGCGTYVLHLYLPETEAIYALELPEIYSAYQLYIDGEEKLQIGDPRRETYRPRTQNRVVIFEGSGMVTILLAVSNYSHFYSGLVYPPAFGTPEGINRMGQARLSLAVCIFLMGLLGTMLAAYLGIRMKYHNAFLFSLLCLSATVFTSYPLLHTMWELSVWPWYALEMVCGHLMTVLVVVLQNRLCRAEGIFTRVLELAGVLFCIMALCYSLFSAQLTTTVMELFSVAAFLFKSGAALWLLVVSLYGVRENRVKNLPLFYASVVYAALLLWDRLLPAYEPVLTGWFTEWGSFLIILVIGYTLWRDIVTAYSHNLAFVEEYRQTKRQLAMQIEYAHQIAECVGENRKLIHDFRHHLRTIGEMVRQISSRPETKQQKELIAYLETFFQTTDFQAGLLPETLCNRAAVDALLRYFDGAALRHRVEAKLMLNIPEGLPLSDIEWCTVLGNLLENALESCQRGGGEHQFIRIFTKWTGRSFFLLVENTYDGKVMKKDGRFLSHKRESAEYGVGLESVKETVEKHGGSLEIYPLDRVFRVGIVLNKKDRNLKAEKIVNR